MAFASPIWLLLLLPWGALATWLLWGRGRQAGVPFLDLWLGDVEFRQTKRSMRLPPVALLAALASLLLAVLATAQPALVKQSRGSLLTVIVDHGLTMSARGRLAEVIDRARQELAAFGPGPVDLIMVPDGSIVRTDRTSWSGLALAAHATAFDTRGAVRRAVLDALARDDAPVIILSDHDRLPDDPRIVQVAPQQRVSNVGVVGLAVRESPHAQAMVTVRNDSELERATLRLRTGEQTVQQAVELPLAGMQRNVFFDLPEISSPLVAELEVADDLAADNRRWLVRDKAWPRVEVRSRVPASVGRVVRAYQQARPPGEGGGVVAVAPELHPGERGVIVAAGMDAAPPTTQTQSALTVQDHPVTRNIAWSNLRLSAASTAPRAPTGREWVPLVTANGVPLVAASGGPAPQAWISIASAEFARTPEFVILWTNLLDFVGGGGEAWTSHELRDLDPSWKPLDPGKPFWPGLWTRADGVTRAFNAPQAGLADPQQNEGISQQLPRLAGDSRGRTELLQWIALASVALWLLAAAAWPRSRLTPPAGLRTV